MLKVNNVTMGFKYLISLIISIYMTTSCIYAQIDIKDDLNKFRNQQSLALIDFSDLIKSYENKGYEIFIVNLNEGYTSPKIIKNDDINSIKEIIKKDGGVTEDKITDKIYPNLFNDYNVEFIESKGKDKFAIFIKSNLTKIILDGNTKDVKISVDGKVPIDVSSEGELELKKGDSYTVTIYNKDGDEIKSQQVNLIDYKSNEYVIKVNYGYGGLILLAIVAGGSFLVGITITKKIKLKKSKNILDIKKEHIKPNEKNRELKLEDKGSISVFQVKNKEAKHIINLNGNILDINDILQDNEYERILQVNVMDELKSKKNKTKNNLRTVKNYINSLIGYNDIDENKSNKVRKLSEVSVEIDSYLDDIQEKIHNLDISIKEIRDFNKTRKINEIKKIVDVARGIYRDLEECYLELDNIKDEQYYLERSIKKLNASNITDIEKQSYVDIVDNNSKIIAKVMEYMINQGNQINDSVSFMKSEIASMHGSIDKLYNNMDKDINRIFESINNSKDSMYEAIKHFDINISKNLNTNINFINEQIEKVKSEVRENKNAPSLSEGINLLKNELNKAVDMKWKSTEDMMEKVVHKIMNEKIYIEKSNLCNRYKNSIDNSSWSYLCTAEHLYEDHTKNKNNKLDDYSFIYIMYSKVLEAELGKCTVYSRHKGLGGIIQSLSKQYGWSNFIDQLDRNQIRDLRNESAHPGVTLDIEDVKRIRGFLLDKSFNDNKICWLDFIINNQN